MTDDDEADDLEFADTVGAAVPAGGICPQCGFYNAPDANVRDAHDYLVFCMNCQHVWREE